MSQHAPHQTNLQVDTLTVDQVTVIAVIGEVDILTAPLLRRALADSAAPLVLDLCDCTFMDSTGVASLIAHLRDGHPVQIACLADRGPGRVLELSMGGRAPIHASREAAVAAARSA